MFKSNWIKWFAFGVIGIVITVAIACGITYITSSYVKSIRDYQVYTQNRTSNEKIAAEIIYTKCQWMKHFPIQFNDCVKSQIRTQNKNDNAYKDAEAQIEVAFWAKYSVIVAIIGLFISILSIGALIYTIIQAKKSLKLTEEAIVNDRESIRANLIIKIDESKWIGSDFSLEDGIVITNTGQSSAYEVRYNARIIQQDQKFSQAEFNSIPDIDIDSNLAGITIGRDGIVTKSIKVNRSKIIDINKRTYIECIVKYIDTFGKHHVTSIRCSTTKLQIRMRQPNFKTILTEYQWKINKENQKHT